MFNDQLKWFHISHLFYSQHFRSKFFFFYLKWTAFRWKREVPSRVCAFQFTFDKNDIHTEGVSKRCHHNMKLCASLFHVRCVVVVPVYIYGCLFLYVCEHWIDYKCYSYTIIYLVIFRLLSFIQSILKFLYSQFPHCPQLRVQHTHIEKINQSSCNINCRKFNFDQLHSMYNLVKRFDDCMWL